MLLGLIWAVSFTALSRAIEQTITGHPDSLTGRALFAGSYWAAVAVVSIAEEVQT